MDYSYKYFKYKTKYLSLKTKKNQYGGNTQVKYRLVSDSDIQSKQKTELDLLFDEKIFNMLQPINKAKIRKLKNVMDINQIKDFISLEELSFGEFFGADGRITIKKGILPETLKKIDFYDYDNTIIEKDALPKNLQEIYCGMNTQILGSVPKNLKVNKCEPQQYNLKVIKTKVELYIDIDNYKQELHAGTLKPNVTHLILMNFDKNKRLPNKYPNTLTHLTLSGHFDQIIPTDIFPPSLKFLRIENENYSYKNQIPKSLQVKYGPRNFQEEW